MKLGFLTACLPDRPLTEIVSWAMQEGFEALEVAAWPALGNRPFTATHLAVENLGEHEADDVKTLFADANLTLSSLAFYDNNLHPDPAERTAINAHVLACIEAASPWSAPRRWAPSSDVTGPSRCARTSARPRRCSSPRWRVASAA